MYKSEQRGSPDILRLKKAELEPDLFILSMIGDYAEKPTQTTFTVRNHPQQIEKSFPADKFRIRFPPIKSSDVVYNVTSVDVRKVCVWS